MKSLMIANAAAGQWHGEDIITELREALGDDMPPVEETKGPGDARRIAFDAARSGQFEVIYAVGGDGTLNEVANGLIAGCEESVRPTLGLIPRGTSNVVASELGIPWPGIPEAIEVLRHGRIKKIDAGCVGDRYFLLAASCGVDAEAVRNVDEPLKNIVGPGAYVMSGLAALATYTPSRMTIRYDAETVTLDAFVVIVSNLSTYGLSNVKVAPFASLDDGWLDVCVFEKPPADKLGFLGQVMLLLARRHLNDPRVRYFRAKHIEIVSDPPVAMQLDGDPLGDTPVTIDIVPKALRILVPAHSHV